MAFPLKNKCGATPGNGDEMKLSQHKKIIYGIIALLFTVGLGVASFFDLAISSSLSGLSEDGGTLSLAVPVYASVLEILGEWPAVILSAVSFLLVISVIAENHKKAAVWIRIFSVFPAGCLMVYGFGKTAEYRYGSLTARGYLAVALLSVLCATAGMLAIRLIPDAVRQRLYYPAAYTLAAAALILVCVSTLKVFWGRIRLRELVAAGSLDGFTPWYRPNFFSGSHSFPSGHTAHNTLTLMLPIWLSGKGTKYRTPLYILCSVFIAFMAVSRLSAGAHYLSDILFGFMIAFVITELAKHRYEKRFSVQTEVS